MSIVNIVNFDGIPEHLEGIGTLLKEVDQEFVPTLSSARGSIKRYIDFLREGEIIICLDYRRVVGIIGYKYNDTRADADGNPIFENEPYISTFAVAKKLRGGQVSRNLELACLEDIKSHSYSSVVLRTWTTNKKVIRMYKLAGFEEFRRIENDPEVGILGVGRVYLRKRLI